jgi:hypothetical protein
MAGYTRQDTANNIANGNVIDADDFDAEYNAVENAFNASTGHKHDGTAGEGAPITKVGPSQNLVVSATNVNPKTSNTLDLGTNLLQYKDGYFDGTVYQDSAIVGVNAYMTLSDNEIDVSTGGLTLDVAGDISLDADGGDVLLKDAGTTFGTFTNDGNNLIVKSGSTTAITLSGADTTLAGTLAVTGASTLNGAVTVSGSHNVTINAGNLTLSSGNATIGGTLSVTGEITGNASTATKLATARTITIDGDVDATATSFDGSANITLTTTLDTVNSNVGSFGSSTAIPVVTVNGKGLVTGVSTAAITTALTVGADSGSNDSVSLASDVLTFAGTTNEIETTVSNNQIQIGLPSNVTIGNNLIINGDLTVSGTTTTVNTETLNLADNQILLNSNETGTPSQNGGIEIERGTSANKTLVWNETSDKWTVGSETFVAGTFEGNLTGNVTGNVTGNTAGTHTGAVVGNASTATALATSRTISLTGDVSGSASFDGTANATITATVADDSHNHVISNVDGLQTALDGKAALAGSSSQSFQASTIDLGDWTITQSGSDLKFAYQGTDRLKLTSAGALTVENDVTAFGSA